MSPIQDDVIKLIAQEGDYLIINKPAGLVVHPPRAGYQRPTLVDWLLENYPEVKKVGDEPRWRPGIVHRLDREVSGGMVIALTQDEFNWLKRQFQERRVLKEYLALVYGQIKRAEGEINLPLEKRFGRTIVKPKGMIDKKVRSACTYFTVLERFQHYTLLEVKISTGRSHQIRAHLANYGHSVVGDLRYCHPGDRKRKAFTNFIKSDRVFLHSGRLGFYNQKMIWREYVVDLPERLQQFLGSLAG